MYDNPPFYAHPEHYRWKQWKCYRLNKPTFTAASIAIRFEITLACMYKLDFRHFGEKLDGGQQGGPKVSPSQQIAKKIVLQPGFEIRFSRQTHFE